MLRAFYYHILLYLYHAEKHYLVYEYYSAYDKQCLWSFNLQTSLNISWETNERRLHSTNVQREQIKKRDIKVPNGSTDTKEYTRTTQNVCIAHFGHILKPIMVFIFLGDSMRFEPKTT